jgi:hypothetical protein
MIQIAAQLLIPPTLEHLVDGLGLRIQYGNRTDYVHATALIDGQNGLQTRLIQCIIESSSESFTASLQVGASHSTQLAPACRQHAASGHPGTNYK